MKVNCKKCDATGMLYYCVKSILLDNSMGTKSIKMLEKQLAQLTVEGERVPFHHPDREPCTHFGVDITPTLNWSL